MSGTARATLTDATILINLFQGGGQPALDAYVSWTNVVITDVVRDEVTSSIPDESTPSGGTSNAYPRDHA